MSNCYKGFKTLTLAFSPYLLVYREQRVRGHWPVCTAALLSKAGLKLCRPPIQSLTSQLSSRCPGECLTRGHSISVPLLVLIRVG